MKSENKYGLLLVAGLVLIFFIFGQDNRQQQEIITNEAGETQPYLHIPKLAVTAPVIFVESTDESDIQTGLRDGVVHYAQTAEFGEIGNAYVIGHSSDYKTVPGEYKTIFKALPELKAGDEVVILDEHQLIYQVIEIKIVEAGDISVLSQDTGGRKLLTLQTSYPIGSSAKRLVVISELK